MLSSLFQVSLDDLVKGDVEIMEQKLKQAKFNVWAHLMTWPMLLVAILAGPVILYSNLLGVVVEISLIALSMIAAFKVDSLKKSYQIQTMIELWHL